jgi:tetratricopeptide (TPR) repeat protein
MAQAVITLLRLHRQQKQSHALFRMLTAEGSLNYHDYTLARAADGRILAIDIYVYVIGEQIWKTNRRLALPLFAQQSKGILDKLISSEADIVRNIDQIGDMAAAIQQGNHYKALRIWEKLPERVKEDRSVLVMRMQAAQQVSVESYMESIDDIRRLFPREAWVSLISIDAFRRRGQFDDALLAIDALDRSVGRDPYLSYVRADTYVAQGQLAQALEQARKAIELEPQLSAPYWVLVAVSLREKDFAKTSQLLTEIHQKFNIEIAGLEQLPEYSEYIQSKEYREWLHSATPDSAALDKEFEQLFQDEPASP